MYELTATVGEAKFTLWAFGPHETQVPGLPSWGLDALLGRGGKTLDPKLRKRLEARLDGILRDLHVRHAYAPNVNPPGTRIIPKSGLNYQLTLSRKTSIHWNYFQADGVFIEPGDAFLICPAGCPILIGAGGARAACVHGCRANMARPGWKDGADGEHESILFALVEAFGKWNVPPDAMAARTVLHIPTDQFGHELDHPDAAYREANYKLFAYLAKWPGSAEVRENTLFLNLGELLLAQARQAGVAEVSVTDSLSEYPDLVHTRKADPQMRNLVIIRRDL
ncbi:hypothetical protein HYV30_04475 [Candidatus Kaiserbacteria bacterium]|nr:hypothetical protein [Candidatus Kaiserbacteria bacterium]